MLRPAGARSSRHIRTRCAKRSLQICREIGPAAESNRSMSFGAQYIRRRFADMRRVRLCLNLRHRRGKDLHRIRASYRPVAGEFARARAKIRRDQMLPAAIAKKTRRRALSPKAECRSFDFAQGWSCDSSILGRASIEEAK